MIHQPARKKLIFLEKLSSFILIFPSIFICYRHPSRIPDLIRVELFWNPLRHVLAREIPGWNILIFIVFWGLFRSSRRQFVFLTGNLPKSRLNKESPPYLRFAQFIYNRKNIFFIIHLNKRESVSYGYCGQ